MNATLNLKNEDIRKFFLSLLSIDIILVVIYLANTQFNTSLEAVRDWFNLDTEATIPSWYSSLQIFCVALVFLIASQHTNNTFRRFLISVSLVFVFLSIDESVGLHERITNILSDVTWVPRFYGTGIWIFLYSIAGLLFTISSLKHILELWRQCRRGTFLMMIGAALLLTGAVGFELISYKYSLYGTESLLYYIEVVIEEFLEMIGTSLILYGSLIFALQMQVKSIK